MTGNFNQSSGGTSALQRRWGMAAGLIAWLTALIAPALTFDIELATSSDSGSQFRFYFQLLSTVIFLLAWRFLARVPIPMLALLGLLSITLFTAYSIEREGLTCLYMDGGRYVMGDVLKLQPAAYLAKEGLLTASCSEQMSHFGGDGLAMWERMGIVARFLILFGLYSLAWLALGLLIVAVVRRTLHGVASPKESV